MRPPFLFDFGSVVWWADGSHGQLGIYAVREVQKSLTQLPEALAPVPDPADGDGMVGLQLLNDEMTEAVSYSVFFVGGNGLR